MGVYSKVVSTSKPINRIRTFVAGVAKDITSAWVFVNGVRKQVFPTTEIWTEVYSKTTSGSFSQSFGFGKYKVVLSGAGGSGGLSAKSTSGNAPLAGAGSAGEKKEFYFNVSEDDSQTVAGKIGAHASASHIRLQDNIAESGTPGTGYASGTSGETESGIREAGVAGSGGGSSNATVDGVNHIAKGGNGGYARPTLTSDSLTGGVGGSGGVSSGTGAAGGSGKAEYIAYPPTDYYSNTGSNGYIRIYKSNFYPE
ncbi:MAG: hypothetical protein J6R99_02920 [Alphaproteobacteria bacterium]|nr:hypothetical protein [Alphaproteobacteria bacterium]MBO7066581.1 hypothetical protein [Alphaproteobacteria bacterium]